jgi:hypothetical protein
MIWLIHDSSTNFGAGDGLARYWGFGALPASDRYFIAARQGDICDENFRSEHSLMQVRLK